MAKTSYNTSVIMPAYNEEKSLEEAVSYTIKAFQSLNIEFEIIIVNDNSKDDTGKIADDLARTNKNVYCVHHKKNQGVGGAFRTGVFNAHNDFVIFIPADSPLDAEDLEVYLARMEFSDIVVGYRTERIGYTFFGRLSSFVYNRLLVPIFFNIGLSDVNWIQVYKRKLFTDGIIEIEHTGIFFLVEILIKARRQHLVITDVPAKMKKRIYGKATCTRFSTMLQTFFDMVKFFYKIHWGKR